MKMDVVVIGIPDVINNLRRLRSALEDQAERSADSGSQFLFSRTRAIVPYMDGDLYNAAFRINISSANIWAWAIGYDTDAVDYAWDVHETPNRNHPTRGPSPEPKQDHFLSEPRDTMVTTWPRTVAEDFRRIIAAAHVGGVGRR